MGRSWVDWQEKDSGVSPGLGRDIADMIQFLYLDTNALDLDREPLKGTVNSSREFIDLGKDFNEQDYVNVKLSTDQDVHRWWDERYKFRGAQKAGARRIRQIGRLYLHKNLATVVSRVENAIAAAENINKNWRQTQYWAAVAGRFRPTSSLPAVAARGQECFTT